MSSDDLYSCFFDLSNFEVQSMDVFAEAPFWHPHPELEHFFWTAPLYVNFAQCSWHHWSTFSPWCLPPMRLQKDFVLPLRRFFLCLIVPPRMRRLKSDELLARENLVGSPPSLCPFQVTGRLARSGFRRCRRTHRLAETGSVFSTSG